MHRKPCFLQSFKFLCLRKLIFWRERYVLISSRKSVFTDTVFLMNSRPFVVYEYILIFSTLEHIWVGIWYHYTASSFRLFTVLHWSTTIPSAWHTTTILTCPGFLCAITCFSILEDYPRGLCSVHGTQTACCSETSLLSMICPLLRAESFNYPYATRLLWGTESVQSAQYSHWSEWRKPL